MTGVVRTVPSGPVLLTARQDLMHWLGKRLEQASNGQIAAVVDPAVSATAAGQELLNELGNWGRLTVVDPAADSEELDRLLREIGSIPFIVGVGGGTAMDSAKLAAAVRTPRHRAAATSHSRSGHVVLSDDRADGTCLILVPTTLGTGAEMGLNACLMHRGHRRLLSGSPLRADAALLDPTLTGTLPTGLLLAGTFEAIFRISTLFVHSSHGRTSSDVLALATIQALARSGEEISSLPPPCSTEAESLRRDIAELSAFSQTGWTSLGRNQYGTAPWIIATEVSTALGITKMDAVCAILPGIWQRIEQGDFRFGHPARLTRVREALSAAGALDFAKSASDGIQGLLKRWFLDREFDLDEESIEVIARRTARAWGAGLPMLGGLTSTDVADFLLEAFSGSDMRLARTTGAA